MRRPGTAAAIALATVVALGACSDDGGSDEALCERIRTDRSLGSVFAGFDPSDPERALDQLRTARVTLGELRDAAPGSLRDELDVEIAYIQALVDGLEAAEGADPAVAVEIVRQITEEHPGVDDAAEALTDFTRQRCGP